MVRLQCAKLHSEKERGLIKGSEIVGGTRVLLGNLDVYKDERIPLKLMHPITTCLAVEAPLLAVDSRRC